jgi:hypothetical protein
VLAAYVADEALLGRSSTGFQLVRNALHHGYLRPQSRYELGPTGRRFVRQLRRFLERTGYL